MPFVDQYNDPAYGVLVRQLNDMPELKEFVKEASLESSEAASLPDAAFAWPEERRYPVHTEKHAALSWGYILAEPRVPSHVKARVKEALEVYNIPEMIFASTQKTAAAELPARYLLPKDGLLPAGNKHQVKVSQAQLLEQANRLDVERRVEASVNLVKVAEEMGVDVHPRIQQMAGVTVSNTRVMRNWLEARVEATPEPIYKLAYQTLADGLAKQPTETRDRTGLVKLAQTIATLDQKSGLVRHYDRKLPDPMSTVFNTEKVAAACVDLCGVMVPISKLASLPASFWGDLGGAELADEVAPGGSVDVSKLAEVVETLPLDYKLVLKSQLRM